MNKYLLDKPVFNIEEKKINFKYFKEVLYKDIWKAKFLKDYDALIFLVGNLVFSKGWFVGGTIDKEISNIYKNIFPYSFFDNLLF